MHLFRKVPLKKGTLDKTRSSEKILFVSSEETIYFPDKVLTDRQLIELRGLVSMIPQHLNQHVRNQIMPLLSSYNDRWKGEFLPLLEKSKQIEIVTFVNEVNSGFKLAYEAMGDNESYFKQMTPENKMHMYDHQYFGEREEGNQQKLEQARDIFVKLGKRLPNVLSNKDIMLEDIRKLLNNNKEITNEEAKGMLGFDILKPMYLPERFKFSGTYVNKNEIGYPSPMIRQVWYDLDKLEMLMVEQTKHESKDLNYEVIFSDKSEGYVKMLDIYSWAKYRCEYQYIKSKHYVRGFMLVNDESNRVEYENILKSLK